MNIWVNETADIPVGYSRRALLCSTDGYVLVDVITFAPQYNNFNFYTATVIQKFNPVKTPSPPQTENNINFSGLLLNPEEINIDSTYVFPPGFTQVLTLRCASPNPPELRIDAPPSGETEFLYCQIEDIHTTRLEIQQANYCKYGYASRRSDTTATINYYVARKITLSDGYSIIFRVSYVQNQT